MKSTNVLLFLGSLSAVTLMFKDEWAISSAFFMHRVARLQ